MPSTLPIAGAYGGHVAVKTLVLDAWATITDDLDSTDSAAL